MNKEIFMDLLQAREFKAVRSILNVMNAVDIAALMSELEDKELALAFRLIPKTKAADVFANMNNSMQSYLVEIFTEKELKELLDELFLDDTVDLLEDLPANLVTRILEAVDQEKRTKINTLLNYPGRQRRQCNDNRICRFEEDRHCAPGALPYQTNRNPQGNHIYLLCFGASPSSRHCFCQRFDDDG